MMNAAKLTESQKKALDLVVRNRRYGVGRFGGIRRSTAEVLIRMGLVKRDFEHCRGHLREYLVPAAAEAAN